MLVILIKVRATFLLRSHDPPPSTEAPVLNRIVSASLAFANEAAIFGLRASANARERLRASEASLVGLGFRVYKGFRGLGFRGLGFRV